MHAPGHRRNPPFSRDGLRKAISPVDFADLDALTERILAFQDRYNNNATPFDWTFTRTDLRALLDRIDPPPTQQTLPTAA